MRATLEEETGVRHAEATTVVLTRAASESPSLANFFT
jgi:hypothetical protein